MKCMIKSQTLDATMKHILKRLCHWGPLLAMTIIKCITLTTLHFSSQWIPANSSIVAFANHILFLFFVGATLYNFFCACLMGPGYLPYKWKPEEKRDTKYLQFCIACEGYKAPRCHHCRKCNRCVMKMDHHCPWINNCCGHFNHFYFTAFLFFSVIGAIQATILLSIALYRGYYANWYFYNGDRSKLVYLTLTSFLMCIFSIGLSVGVILAVGGLLIIQLKTILRNKTSIEDWIVTKAESRERDNDFKYPYDLGKWQNFKQVFFMPLGNGIEWPVVDGCDKYTLTVEQLIQKSDKRSRIRYFQATSDYNGSWFPLLSQGLRTCIKFPCSDEPRLPLKGNDIVSVTRWKKYWLYGEKVVKCDHNLRAKGWFPRQCVVEVTLTNKEIFKQISQANDTHNRKKKLN